MSLFELHTVHPLRVSVMCGHVGVVNTVHSAISDLFTTVRPVTYVLCISGRDVSTDSGTRYEYCS